MRQIIDTSKIRPGKKAADWEYFCLILDNCRKGYDPDYHPMRLSEEQQRRDWEMFQTFYEGRTSLAS